MIINPLSSHDATSGASSASNSSSSASSGINTAANALASEQTFLKLFVAQLQNQDPTQPQDPTQFVTQLAQFSDLEQNLQSRVDLDGILSTLQTDASAAASTSSSQSTTPVS